MNRSTARSSGVTTREEDEKMPGRPGPLRTDFGLSRGARIDPREPTGYYIDMRAKAPDAVWPPAPPPTGRSPRPWVVLLQWALGCHERWIAGEGGQWLRVAREATDYLLEHQVRTGPQRGGWVHGPPYKHTYPVPPDWLSGMAQGQAASLLVRLDRATGDERYREAALLAIEPTRASIAAGGVSDALADGMFPQEFPTDPPSHVLNGGIFGLWGWHDVAVAYGDSDVRELRDRGFAALAASLEEYDTGSWSRYDLYPHPVINVAHAAYHRLHIEQLRATALIDSDPRFEQTARRFEGYARSWLRQSDAFARKALFRLLVPRNRFLAGRLPWSHQART